MAHLPARRRARIQLTSFEVLVATDARGSISSAARELGIAQPTASSALRRLERQLGLVLLARSSRGTELTDVGRTVATWAGEVLDASDRFERGITALTQAPVTRIRIAASLTIAEYLAPRWLSRPELTESGTDIELLVHNSARVMDSVLAGEASLGFVEGASVARGLRARTLVTDALTVVVGAEHQWARRRAQRASVAEFLAANLVVREPGSGTRQTLENALSAAGHTLPEHVAHFGSTASLKLAVQAGNAVTALSRLAVEDDLERGILVEIAIPGLDLTRHLRMVWRADQDMPPRVRAIAGLIASATRSESDGTGAQS